MHITKLEHCCLVIKVNNVTLLTDPGTFGEAQNSVTGIHAVLITHEHGDHLHIDSLKAVLKNNPQAVVIANTSTGKMLDQAGISHTIIDGRQTAEVNGVSIEAFDGKHGEIYEEIGQVQNTGYFINREFFIPGDSFQVSAFDKPVQILALPVAGPWCSLADAIRYALKVKPVKAFPIHDGMIRPGFGAFAAQILATILAKGNIEFVPLGAGDGKDFNEV